MIAAIGLGELGLLLAANRADDGRAQSFRSLAATVLPESARGRLGNTRLRASKVAK
jgi:hypothetical protein